MIMFVLLEVEKKCSTIKKSENIMNKTGSYSTFHLESFVYLLHEILRIVFDTWIYSGFLTLRYHFLLIFLDPITARDSSVLLYCIYNAARLLSRLDIRVSLIYKLDFQCLPHFYIYKFFSPI